MTFVLENEQAFDLLPLEKVIPNPDQPRKNFDDEALAELADSIKANGVLQPILVRRRGDRYQIVSGERRYRACKLAGITHIPAVMRNLDEEQTLLAGLIENVQREDLNPIEEASTLRRIILEFGLTHEELARRLGKSRSALTNRLRLLSLPLKVQTLISKGVISAGHAKMLAGLKNSDEIHKWTDKIISKNLSVYETEKELAEERSKRKEHRHGHSPAPADRHSRDIHVLEVESKLQELLGAKVRIRQGRSKSHIEIEFYGGEDLERVVELMLSLQQP